MNTRHKYSELSDKVTFRIVSEKSVELTENRSLFSATLLNPFFQKYK